MLDKIDVVGKPCRHCQTPVVRSTHTKPPKHKPGGYYFEWWLACPNCKALYMQESAKRWFDTVPPDAAAKRAEGLARNIAAMFGEW